MKKLSLPKYLIKYLWKMGILMLIFTLCRVLFFFRNSAFFPEVGTYEFVVGMWFDLITTCLLFLPLVAVELFPNRNRKAKWFRWTVFILTFSAYFFGIILNMIDIEYFAFSASRASNSMFVMLGFGSDLIDQLPSYFADYWYWMLLFFAFIIGSMLWIKKIYSSPDDSRLHIWWKQGIIYIVMIGITILFARGGFVSKPIRPTEASKYTEATNAQLVLNSAFTVINTWGSTTIEEKHYFQEEGLVEHFSPIHQYGSEGRLKGQNVVVIILESFAIEYISSLNPDELSYTPFFDQMVDSSLAFNWAFANGKKSLDALPSIAASVPKMMDDEYLLTSYSSNEVESLPAILGEMGYETGFYHGATNGSMNFDAFCSHIGYDHYYGRDEYGNDADFDGTWGIYDEEFMQWSVSKFSEMRKPFFATLFTISSHPPYSIPEKYKGRFSSESEIGNSIAYTDMALERFFATARQQDWYDSTLFILTADHTPSSNRKIYVHDRGNLHIPLLMYHPSDTTYQSKKSDRIVSHIDIMPTILDEVGYNKEFFSFGHSIFDTIPGYSFSQIAGKYYLMEHDGPNPHILIFQNEETIALYHFLDTYQVQDLQSHKPDVVERMQNRLKAIIQTYNAALIKNKMKATNY